jgi:hypothetical protein
MYKGHSCELILWKALDMGWALEWVDGGAYYKKPKPGQKSFEDFKNEFLETGEKVYYAEEIEFGHDGPYDGPEDDCFIVYYYSEAHKKKYAERDKRLFEDGGNQPTLDIRIFIRANLGRVGGSVKSAAKTAANRENAKKPRPSRRKVDKTEKPGDN